MKILRGIILASAIIGAGCVSSGEIVDLESARIYCDSRPLAQIEGIWEFTEDGLSVLIRKNDNTSGSSVSGFDMIAVYDSSGIIPEGDRIGFLYPTVDSGKYKMQLIADRKKNPIAGMKTCLAVFDDREGSLEVKEDSRKIKFNPLGFLPHFWRIVRLRSEKPSEDIPKGLLRVYPSYDGNGSIRRTPRYL